MGSSPSTTRTVDTRIRTIVLNKSLNTINVVGTFCEHFESIRLETNVADIRFPVMNTDETILAFVVVKSNGGDICAYNLKERNVSSVACLRLRWMRKLVLDKAGEKLIGLFSRILVVYSVGTLHQLYTIECGEFTLYSAGFTSDGARLVVENNRCCTVMNAHTSDWLGSSHECITSRETVIGKCSHLIARIYRSRSIINGTGGTNVYIHDTSSLEFQGGHRILHTSSKYSSMLVCFGMDDATVFTLCNGNIISEFDSQSGNKLRSMESPHIIPNFFRQLLFCNGSRELIAFCSLRRRMVLFDSKSDDLPSRSFSLDSNICKGIDGWCDVVGGPQITPKRIEEGFTVSIDSTTELWDCMPRAQGVRLATVSDNCCEVRIIDLSTGALAATVCHTGYIAVVSVCHSGSRMITVSASCSSSTGWILTLWSVVNQVVVARCESPSPESIRLISFSEQVNIFVVDRDDALVIFDTESCSVRMVIALQYQHDIGFSSINGNVIVRESLTSQECIEIDVETGARIAVDQGLFKICRNGLDEFVSIAANMTIRRRGDILLFTDTTTGEAFFKSPDLGCSKGSSLFCVAEEVVLL